MKTLQLIIVSLGTILSLGNLILYLNLRDRKDVVINVFNTLLYLGFTLFSIVVFYILALNHQEENLLLIFINLGCICQLCNIHSFIKFDDTGFYKFNLLFNKKRIEYTDINKIHVENHFMILELSNTKIKINKNCLNYLDFTNKVKKLS